MSALPPKADVCGANRRVCFGPEADIALAVLDDSAAWDRFRMNLAPAPIIIVPVGEPTTPVVASSVDPDERLRGTPKHQARR